MASILDKIRSAVTGPVAKEDPTLKRRLQERGIVDISGRANIDPDAVRAQRERQQDLLRGQIALQRQIGFQSDDIGRLAQRQEQVAVPFERAVRVTNEFNPVSVIPREAARLGISLGKTAKEGVTGQDTGRFIPKNPIAARLLERGFGEERGIGSLETQRRAAEQTAKDFGFGKTGQLTFSALGIPALTALDLSPGGSGEKRAAKKLLGSIDEFDPQRYVKEMVAKQKEARTPPVKGVVQKGKDFLGELKVKLVDSTAPIEDALSSWQKQTASEIRPIKDVSDGIDRVLRAPSIASEYMKRNGLENVMQQVDSLDEFNQYLIAKRHVELKSLKGEDALIGRNLDQDRKLILSLADKYEGAAQGIKQYTDSLLDTISEAGLVSRELAEKLKAENKAYVPMQRIFDGLDETLATTPKRSFASLASQNIIQKFKGSTRQIENPLESLVDMTNRAILQSEKNTTAKNLVDTRLLEGNPLGVRALKAGEEAQAGEGVLNVLENGVKKRFAAPQPIVQAAKDLAPQHFGLLAKISSIPVRVARAGITGINLPFVVGNIARDQFTAFVQSSKAAATNPLTNPGLFMRSFMSAIRKDELYDDFVRAAGGGTRADISRSALPQTVQRIRAQKNIGTKAKYLVTHPSELFRAVEDIINIGEEATRIQQFEGTRRALLKEGASQATADILGGRAARENTVNFMRRGEWGKALNAAVLYLNSGIQGSRTFLRTLQKNPKGASLKLAGGLFAPAALITMWNLNNEDTKQAYDDIQEFEKENNFIIVSPNPTKDPKTGLWNVIKIPLPAGMGQSASIIRHTLEGLQSHDPSQFAQIGADLFKTFTPVSGNLASTLTPEIAKTPVQLQTNTRLFTNTPIISDRQLQQASPELQFDERTSGGIKLLGQKFGISPMKTEFAIKDRLGGVGAQIINGADRVLAKMGVISPEEIGGESILGNLKRRFGQAFGGEKQSSVFDEIQQIRQQRVDQNIELRNRAELLFQEFSQLPKDEANAKAAEIKKESPLLFDKLKDVVEENKLGLSGEERLIKSLGVTSGDRARFIWKQLQELPSDEARNAMVKEFQDKKIITKNVKKQLKELIRTGELSVLE